MESYMKFSLGKHTFITCQVNYSWEKIETCHFKGHRGRIHQKTHGAHWLICPKTAEHLVCSRSDTILIFCTKPNIMCVYYENGLIVTDSLYYTDFVYWASIWFQKAPQIVDFFSFLSIKPLKMKNHPLCLSLELSALLSPGTPGGMFNPEAKRGISYKWPALRSPGLAR